MSKRIDIKEYCLECSGEKHKMVRIEERTYWYCVHCGELEKVKIIERKEK